LFPHKKLTYKQHSVNPVVDKGVVESVASHPKKRVSAALVNPSTEFNATSG